MGRRNELDIYADILQVAMEGARKTEIVYKANLNFTILKKYLRRLIDRGLIEPTEDRRFITTKRGFQFLEQYRELIAPITSESENQTMNSKVMNANN